MVSKRELRNMPTLAEVYERVKGPIELEVDAALTRAALTHIDTSGSFHPLSPDVLGRRVTEDNEIVAKAYEGFARTRSIVNRFGLLLAAENERVVKFPLSLVSDPNSQRYQEQHEGIDELLGVTQQHPFATKGPRWQVSRPETEPEPVLTSQGAFAINKQRTDIATIWHGPTTSLIRVEKQLVTLRERGAKPHTVRKLSRPEQFNPQGGAHQLNANRNPAHPPMPGVFDSEIFVASAIWAYVQDRQSE